LSKGFFHIGGFDAKKQHGAYASVKTIVMIEKTEIADASIRAMSSSNCAAEA
jgi:hypothetical protein